MPGCVRVAYPAVLVLLARLDLPVLQCVAVCHSVRVAYSAVLVLLVL